MSSDKDDINTLATTAAAVGGAVGTSQLLYRPDSIAEMKKDAKQSLEDARVALDAKISAGPEGRLPTPTEVARTINVENTREAYGKAYAQYESDIVNVKNSSVSPKEAKRALSNSYKELESAGRASGRAESEAVFSLGGRGFVKGEMKEVVDNVRSERKLVQSLAKIESANAEKGIWAAIKRPATILRHGDGKSALAVLGGAAAVGAIVYGIGKAISSERRSDSFADRIQQQQMEAALAAGAGPARS